MVLRNFDITCSKCSSSLALNKPAKPRENINDVLRSITVHGGLANRLQIFTTTSVEIGCFFRTGFLKTLFAASTMLVERVLSAGFPFLSVGSKEWTHLMPQCACSTTL